MPDKQLNKGLKFTPEESKLLKQFFYYNTTAKKNIHRLFQEQGDEYAAQFIELCNQSIDQGYITKELHDIIKDSNFSKLFADFAQKEQNNDSLSQHVIKGLQDIVDRLSKQLTGLTMLGKIDLPETSNPEHKIKQSLKKIALAFQSAGIAYNIFDDGSQDSDIEKIKHIIKKNIGGNKPRKNCYQLVYNYIDPSTIGKNMGEVPANWDIFVEGVYRAGGVQMPPRDSLKMNFTTRSSNIEDYVGKKMIRSEFLKIQNLSEDAINNNDIILGRYTGAGRDYKGKSFFTVGRSIDIATQTEYVDGELEDGVVYKLFIKSKIENRNPNPQKKFLFHSDVIID